MMGHIGAFATDEFVTAFVLPSGGRSERANACAKITARCRQQNQHAYSLFLQLEKTGIADIHYSKGSAKFASGPSSLQVETAVALFCAYAKGKQISEVREVTFRRLAEYFQFHPLSDQTQNDEPLRSLYNGGAIPFMLFRWSLLNHAVKSAVGRVLGVAPNAQIFFRDVAQVHSLVRELSRIPAFHKDTRALELAVRAMHMNTVDESTLRTIYQRATQNELLEDAARRGFSGDFR